MITFLLSPIFLRRKIGDFRKFWWSISAARIRARSYETIPTDRSSPAELAVETAAAAPDRAVVLPRGRRVGPRRIRAR